MNRIFSLALAAAMLCALGGCAADATPSPTTLPGCEPGAPRDFVLPSRAGHMASPCTRRKFV